MLDDVIKVFGTVELFRGLTPEQMTRLAGIARKEVFNASETIFQQDTPGDKMYIINAGQVEVRINDQNGNGHAAVYLGRGQVVGEMALIDQGDRSATIIAVDDNTEVYCIFNQDFINLCEHDTAIGYILMRNLAQDVSFKLRHSHLDSSEHA